MMNPEVLQAELIALRRLYGLLITDGQFVQDAGSENLDNNARLLLRNLLDGAAKKAFEDHQKILGTQFRTSYNPWSMGQEQPLFLQNPPTGFTSGVQNTTKDSSLQKVDLITGEGIFGQPTNQMVSSGQSKSISPGESGSVSLKRCRVCQKPKVKQLTREISIQEREALTINKLFSDKPIFSINTSQNQNHKRSWEVGTDPGRVGGSACSSSSPLTVNFVEPPSLYNRTNEHDQISREAYAKIQQIESHIMACRLASKYVDLFKTESDSKLSQTGNFSVGRSDPKSSTTIRRTWKPRDTAHQLVNMRPGDQTMSQAAQKANLSESEMLNQINYQYERMPVETSNPFYSAGISSNLNKMAENNRSLYGNFSSQINREQFDQIQMAKKIAMRTSEMAQWLLPPVGSSELQEVEITRQKKPDKTYKDKMEHLRGIQGKHEVVDRKRFVSPASQSLSDSPVPTSNSSSSSTTQSQSQSQSQSPQAYTSSSESESESESEGSSLVGPTYSSEREMNSESSRSRGHEESESESELYSASSKDQSPNVSSSSESSRSMSRKTAPTKGYKKGNQKEPKRKQVVGRLRKLKDKLAIIFHHHHHHHHHHHDGDKKNLKKALWKNAGKALGHTRKKIVEKYGEKVVNKKQEKAVACKVLDKTQKGHLKVLVGGLLKHARQPKKSKKSKGGVPKIPKRLTGQNGGGKMATKMRWWQMLQRQRRIKKIQKLRGKLDR